MPTRCAPCLSDVAQHGAIYCGFLPRIPALVAPKILGTEATNLVLKIFVFGSLMIKEMILCFPSSNSSPYIAMVWTPRQIG
jgi:hypothetical protein